MSGSHASMARAVRQADIRQANQRVVLQILMNGAACSKAELARLSGLSAPTVGSAVTELAAIGLIEIVGDGVSSGGRRPELLRFHAGFGYVAGIDIGGTWVRMVLSNLIGKVVGEWQSKLDGKDPISVSKLICRGLEAMCADARIVKKRILHLTAGAPGITDVSRGVVLSAPNLTDWNDVPLRSLIKKATGIPTTVENDTNLAAVGEFWRGSAKSVENFVFIAMGTGVGAGIYLNGKLHHGAAWSAGEIGYLAVHGMPYEAPRVQRIGQLERVIGGKGIEQHWLQQLKQSGRKDTPLKRLRGTEIFNLAPKGDRDAKSVLAFTARVLSEAITTITLLFNPKLIVLGGGVGANEGLRAETERMLADSDFPHPEIKTSILGTQAQLYGALSLALSEAESKLLC